MMKNLPEKYIYMYHHFLWRKLVVRTGAGYFKAVASDMKWKQSIQSLKKGPGGITGQTKQQVYITEWELVYLELIKISRCFNNLTRSDVTEVDATPVNKKLRSKNILEYKVLKTLTNFQMTGETHME